MNAPPITTATVARIVVPYALLMAIIVGLVLRGRDWALSELATDTAHDQWQTWRDDAGSDRDPQAGTVARRVPRSSEPPGLVLMRDYFAVCLVAAVVFTSLIYAVIVWMLLGAFRSRAPS
jgi:hypothetical protein